MKDPHPSFPQKRESSPRIQVVKVKDPHPSYWRRPVSRDVGKAGRFLSKYPRPTHRRGNPCGCPSPIPHHHTRHSRERRPLHYVIPAKAGIQRRWQSWGIPLKIPPGQPIVGATLVVARSRYRTTTRHSRESGNPQAHFPALLLSKCESNQIVHRNIQRFGESGQGLRRSGAFPGLYLR